MSAWDDLQFIVAERDCYRDALTEIAARLVSAAAETDCFNVCEARELARSALHRGPAIAALVRCVNSHDALVAALERARDIIAREALSQGGNRRHDDSLTMIHAALAAATGDKS